MSKLQNTFTFGVVKAIFLPEKKNEKNTYRTRL